VAAYQVTDKGKPDDSPHPTDDTRGLKYINRSWQRVVPGMNVSANVSINKGNS